MALVAVPGGFYYPPYAPGAHDSTSSSAAIDAADERQEFICEASQAGELAKVIFLTGTVTTGATVDVRLETVDLATGLATGTLLDTNSNASQVIDDTDDNTQFVVTLTATATVTQGQKYAIVIVNPAADFGNMRFLEYNPQGTSTNFPYSVEAVDVKQPQYACMGVIYDSDVYHGLPHFGYVITSSPTATFSTATTPEQGGLRFSVPFDCVVRGLWIVMDSDGTGEMRLLDGPDIDNDILATATFDNDVRYLNSFRIHHLMFDGDASLSKDTFYRLVIQPLDTNTVRPFLQLYSEVAHMDLSAGGQNFHYTTAKDPTIEGDWTQTLTTRPLIGLWIVEVHDGAGGGGGGGAPKQAGRGGGMAG